MTTHRPSHLPPGTEVEDSPTKSIEVPPLAADLVTLPSGHLACQTCGVAVPDLGEQPTVVEVTAIEGRVSPPPDPRTGAPRPLMGVRLLRCSDCRESDRTVAALMARHPRAVAQLGPAGAEAMFTRMLEALTVLGRPLPDDADVPVLSRHLSRFGLVFRLRFVPVARAEDDRAKCSPRPWAHVDEETRTELRSAYAAYLHEKAVAGAPPLEIPPPAADSTRGAPVDGGCLFCGRATVTTPAREAGRAVWRPLTASASALGSRVARQVTGHLCPDCSQARDEVGATGVPAMDRALHRYLKDAGRDAEARQVVQGETYGLVAWGVLARREPTTEPWAHVAVSLTDEREIPVWSAPLQPARRPRKAAKRKAAASPAGKAPAAPASTSARSVDMTRF